jgi:hypothetical protein
VHAHALYRLEQLHGHVLSRAPRTDVARRGAARELSGQLDPVSTDEKLRHDVPQNCQTAPTVHLRMSPLCCDVFLAGVVPGLVKPSSAARFGVKR